LVKKVRHKYLIQGRISNKEVSTLSNQGILGFSCDSNFNKEEKKKRNGGKNETCGIREKVALSLTRMNDGVLFPRRRERGASLPLW